MILLISSALITFAIFSPKVVVGGWWLVSAGHQPPTTNHQPLRIHQSPLQLRQLAFDRAVVNQTADAGDDAADDRGICSELQPHLLAGRGLQLVLQRGLFLLA